MSENIVGKGENAGYQHFLLFPKCFLRLSFLQFVFCGTGLIGLLLVLSVTELPVGNALVGAYLVLIISREPV